MNVLKTMPALFRSEKMHLCSMVLHYESAFEVLVQLGYMGCVEFIDSNDGDSEMGRKYTGEVYRCNDILRIIRLLELEVHDNVYMKSVYYPEVDLDEVPRRSDLKEIEAKVHVLHEDLTEIDRNMQYLRRREAGLKEEFYALNVVENALKGQHNTERIMAWSDSIVMKLIHDETKQRLGTAQKLRFFAGTIPVERYNAFEVMLFRIVHHNFYVHKENIPEPLEDVQGSQRRKLAFIIVFVGERTGELIAKICQGFHVRIITVDVASEDRIRRIDAIESDLRDLKEIFERAKFERNQILAVASGDLFIWKVLTLKILAIYMQMNKMTVVRNLNVNRYLQSKCWLPEKDLKQVHKALLRGARRAAEGDMSMMFPPTVSVLKDAARYDRFEPPSLFRLNKFTHAFQNLIDAYGIPNYQELNPAPYITVTFPFLFAIMYGDMGHGIIMLVFAIWMVRNEKHLEEERKRTKITNEMWDLLFSGRYILLMMGLFSIYTGFIYNDMFSKSLNIFGSSWRVRRPEAEIMQNTHIELDPATFEYKGHPYIIGVDPVWKVAGESSITFLNSFKMKLSIIFGVLHMLFGLSLFAYNCVFFRNAVDFYMLFVPQLAFLILLFGYLVVIILYKWAAFGGHYESPYNSACAPSILITFIDMVLFKPVREPQRGCEDEMIPLQSFIQILLLVLALLSIPIMFAAKPLHIMRQRHKELHSAKYSDAASTSYASRPSHASTVYRYSVSDIVSVGKSDGVIEQAGHIEEPTEVWEIWIHSFIHTMETVLGTISHTASYLRLWALSLAHDQLSSVLWTFILGKSFSVKPLFGRAVVLFICFGAWSVFTVAIMVIMEGLSAFLHTLRLHWVEFQSKFYKGTGVRFTPFKFEEAARVELLTK